MKSLTEILTPATFEECVVTLLAIAANLNAPTTSWQQGNPNLTQTMTAAQKVSDLSLVAVEIARGGFGDLLPSDDWADIWGKSRYNELRIPAKAAVGYGTATNASDQSYPLEPGELIVAHDVTGKTYRNQEAIEIPANDVLEDILIQADETGIASNAAPGAIQTVVSSLVGVTFTNPESLLGSDKETTPDFVERCYAKLSSFSPNGPKEAYKYVATTQYFSDGTPCSPTSVPITRAENQLDEITGILYVYLATATGAPSPSDVAIVQDAFDQYVEPWGAQAVAVAATPVVFPITYQSWLNGTRLTAAQIESAQATALATWFSRLNIGGYVIPPNDGSLYVDALEQAIGQSVAGTLRVRVTVPAADVVLNPFEVAVLGALTPTTTILT